ncbi:MAG: carboxypeptidase regulatory-like domain-containing protein [Candidatus Sulfotelmatobacter sp.]
MALALLLASTMLFAQSTVGTGSVQGIVTDQTGAVLAGAKVTVTNRATALAIHLTTTSAGAYSSGPIQPGDYSVRVEAKGFKTLDLLVTVQVGNTSTGNFQMQVGLESQLVEVQGAAITVNTEQATVQGVLTGSQIDNLPVNGRNFLDLAQLEPGVQIQEGSTFDPTKNGFSSISFGGRFGRTARIELDGVDISDETVGTTTQNIPASAIQEFQLSQSSLDLSTELTSSGAVNVTTRSGSNDLHGEAFGIFRGNQTAARLPGPSAPPFQRQQFGGRLGGFIIKDKLFWFIDAERTKQDLVAAQPFTSPFDGLNTTLGQPYRELMNDGKLDWQIRSSAHLFYRFNFDQNSQIRPFGSASSLQGFRNTDHTPSHTIGLDFNTGNYTHSFRFAYLRFHNQIGDGTSSIPAGPDNPVPGLGISIGAPVTGNCVISVIVVGSGGAYCGGPNFLAPQQTYQSDHEVKYDGSKIVGAHIIRYGVAFNHLQGGGLAAFFTFPQVGTSSVPVTSNPADPTTYPIQWAQLGNGVGFSTAEKAFNFPGGGQGPDNRLQLYVGDGWKIRPNLTLTYGLHYVRDTGRVDSNLGPLPILNNWGAGLGNQVRTPGDDFAPQIGLAWDPAHDGKTVLRVGGGLFYENSIWNNVLFDSPARIPKGIFSYTPIICSPSGSSAMTWPTNPGAAGAPIAGGAGLSNGDGTVSPTFCGETIAAGGSQVLALSSAFKAAAATAGLVPNPNFIGSSLANCGQPGNACDAANANGFDIFDPNYRTPRSWQMNVGIQRQIRPGMVFSADYIRNIGEHFLLAIDKNYSGSARSFNVANAKAARDAAQTSVAVNGTFCPPGPNEANCVVNANQTLVSGVLTCVGGGPPPCTQTLGISGAQAAYSAAGLDSNIAVTGGAPCGFCAFPGTNGVLGNTGQVGTMDMLEPVGRSVYSGLQIKLTQNVTNPIRGVKSANFQLSYALSKFVSQVQDQDFVNVPVDNDNPLAFTGPNGLDRTHQVSFGGTLELPFYTRLSLIGHFYSPLPQNIQLPELTSGGEIFATDWVGSGLGSSAPPEPVPGTHLGQFERGTDVSNLHDVISNYNTHFAGTLTPAGNQLVGQNVMTSADMTALNWVMPTLPSLASGAIDFPWLKSFDFAASWPIKIKERLTVEPSVSMFNIFNFSNEFLPGNLPLSALLPCSTPGCTTLAPGVIGGVTQASLLPFRASFQSGTYALGAPRQFEFGLKVLF